MQSRILIIGANGYLGRHLTRFLARRGKSFEIFALDRHLTKEFPEGVTFHKNNLNSIKDLKSILRNVKPHRIFHLAAKLYSSEMQDLVADNVNATFNVFEAMKSTLRNGSKTVLISSAAEYGLISSSDLPVREGSLSRPYSLYGLTKSWQTSLGQFYARMGLDIRIARIFNIIGPGMSENLPLGSIARQIYEIKHAGRKPVIHIGNIHAKRDFLYIDDVLEALLALSRFGESGEVYNVCSGKSWSIAFVLNKMLKYSGVRARIEVDSKTMIKNEILNIFGSNLKIRRETGWRPNTHISDALKIIANSTP